jgi:thiol peroxidase
MCAVSTGGNLRTVTYNGVSYALVGNTVVEGGGAPDFRVVAQDLSPRSLADYRGFIKVFTTFPSLDTPYCQRQIKGFNERATALGEHVRVIGVSTDLPFAQTRFCQMFNIQGVELVSDYQDNSFGTGYGLLIGELKLLARSVVIVDQDDVVRYVQITKEVNQALDNEDVFIALDRVVGRSVASSR